MWSLTQKWIFQKIILNSNQKVTKTQRLAGKVRCHIRKDINSRLLKLMTFSGRWQLQIFLSWYLHSSLVVEQELSWRVIAAGGMGEIRGWLPEMPFFPTGLAEQVPGPPGDASCFPETRAILRASAATWPALPSWWTFQNERWVIPAWFSRPLVFKGLLGTSSTTMAWTKT